MNMQTHNGIILYCAMRIRIAAPLLLLAALAGRPAYGQIDFSGIWTPLYHEDQPERLPGPELGDYLGLPINDAARLRAESWDASRLTVQEHQCRVHISPYIYRGPLEFRVWEEKDPETQQIVAIKNFISTFEQERTIWMDGRPHPPAYAAHTWMGFSTGKWEGNILTVYTTHIKTGWIRRNGVPESDRATLTEHFIVHDKILTHVSIVTDPAYLTEPLIKTQNFFYDPGWQGAWIWPCEYVEEVTTRAKDAVPNYLPGENPFMKEFTDRWKLPPAAALGGVETSRPEYRLKLKDTAAMAAKPVNLTSPIPREPITSDLPDDNGVHLLPVQGNIYMLASASGNTTVQVGSQGILLVDAQPAALSGQVIDALAKLSKKPIRYLINTSADPAHTSGNDALRKAGVQVFAGPGARAISDAAEGAAIIAHINVLNRMSAPTGSQSSTTTGNWPTDTFEGGVKELFFNGESLRVFHQPAAYSDGDSLVYFRRSDVLSAGNLMSTVNYPVIDLAKGGSLQGVIDGLNRLLDLAVPEHEQEGGTMIIPGRGRLCDEADLVEYRDMIQIIKDRITAMLKKNMTLAQVKAARPTLDYDPLYGAMTGPWTTDMFVEAAYKSLSAAPKPTAAR
jgi:cyclase